jgi:hypothetical protein
MAQLQILHLQLGYHLPVVLIVLSLGWGLSDGHTGRKEATRHCSAWITYLLGYLVALQGLDVAVAVGLDRLIGVRYLDIMALGGCVVLRRLGLVYCAPDLRNLIVCPVHICVILEGLLLLLLLQVYLVALVVVLINQVREVLMLMLCFCEVLPTALKRLW